MGVELRVLRGVEQVVEDDGDWPTRRCGRKVRESVGRQLGQGDRMLRLVGVNFEAANRLRCAVFGDVEVGLGKAGDRLAIGIGDGDVEDDTLHADLEGVGRLLRVDGLRINGPGRGGSGCLSGKDVRDCKHQGGCAAEEASGNR